MEPTYRLVKQEDKWFADKVMETKNTKGPWEAIDLMVEYWKKKNPTEYRSFVVDVKDKKETRQSKTKKGSASWRYTLDIPSQIWQMIVVIFGGVDQINIYDKEFFRKFGHRYPEFRVSDKL